VPVDVANDGIVRVDGDVLDGDLLLSGTVFGYKGTMGRPASERAPALKAATAQRGQLAAAQANLAELKAKQLSGELVEAAEVEAEWCDVLMRLRPRKGLGVFP
jgi:hypothetical protein